MFLILHQASPTNRPGFGHELGSEKADNQTLVATHEMLLRIFFGILPVLKASWDVELHKHRESYYVGHLLG